MTVYGTEQLVMLIGCAALGGLVRGGMGISKALKDDRAGFKFDPPVFFMSLFMSAIAGTLAAFLLNGDWKVALGFGWTGVDGLESLMKIVAPVKK